MFPWGYSASAQVEKLSEGVVPEPSGLLLVGPALLVSAEHFLQLGVVLDEAFVDDELDQVLAVGKVEALFALEAGVLEALERHPGLLVELLGDLLIFQCDDQRLEEKVHSVTEVER